MNTSMIQDHLTLVTYANMFINNRQLKPFVYKFINCQQNGNDKQIHPLSIGQQSSTNDNFLAGYHDQRNDNILHDD